MSSQASRLAARAVAKLTPALARALVLGRYAEAWVQARGLDDKDLESYRPGERGPTTGIDFNLDAQIARAEAWKYAYPELFEALRADPAINTRCTVEDWIHNDYYPTPDAEIYAAMIVDYEPRKIVEVGGGYSTRIARKALTLVDYPCELLVVDPEPRADLEEHADRVILSRVEDYEDFAGEIDEKTILFIDSSHITRARGDIPCLFNNVLPGLPTGTMVHVHDIFLPFDYPYAYQKRLYTEQYVLHALLSHSKRYEVVFSTQLMAREQTRLMQECIGPVVGTDDAFCGASFWFQVV